MSLTMQVTRIFPIDLRKMRVNTIHSLLALVTGSSAGYMDWPKNLCAPTTVTSVDLATVTAINMAAESVEQTTLVSTVTITDTPTVQVQAALPCVATTCLSDDQAKSIVSSFKTILTSSNRSIAHDTAQTLIADEILETSDSINSLAGLRVSVAGQYGVT